ncbi:sensor histidine kinase [Pseudalkalibacillus caeni]|uniref:Sensor histidine kinase n=1 Tax=Exobacillus caeni TaxID=2574798 RepID=A0A5R9FBZ6_9BACL|nr:sensor histidine kinase [Pseudalkalibacillus caeni]TLS38413.1 sensor histidine kinase [Pseudalkalibacillus caeni]
MIRIRTKIMIFVTVLVLLVNGVTYYLYHSSQQTIDEYHDSFQRFIILNQISQQTSLVYEALNAYVIEKTPGYLSDYRTERKRLLSEKEKLIDRVENADNYLTVTNYYNMIDSFLEECEITVKALEEQNLNQYSFHINEASKVSRFIQDTTLSLLNSELTGYQIFYHAMEKKNVYLQAMGISLFISTILLSLLTALWFSKGLTRPISHLSSSARRISKGDFSGKDVQVNTNDEMQLLAGTFNNMRRNIRELIKEIKDQSELDRLLKEMELKSLQSQINPHFLFNTLNTVSRLAYLEGADKTSDLIGSVSALLRYNLGNLEKPTVLRDEVRIVKEYFFIQQTRFGDRVSFESAIDDSCLDVSIPILTLQPIVENAFIHGIESYEHDAKIGLNVYSKSGQVILEVWDNGVGMDGDERARLLSRDDKKEKHLKSHGHSTGLGMKNVIKRLDIFYKNQCEIEISSEVNEGTIVRIKLPYTVERRGEQYASNYGSR